MKDLAVIAVTFVVITSMYVHYDGDVKVVINYDLDGAEGFGAYLFGTDKIKDDVLSIFESSDYTIEKLDFHTAIVKFRTQDFGDYRFFEGVKLAHPVNMTIVLSKVFSFNITSDEIPQAYIFE
ncbi:hypothetical protein [Archaeoglobus profundus]|uniref:Uncharacterized protein n=1 Tax=Archaeoglobus profundus (strain DSM 5631 / JCM 9629 / NBRC 100127 / Av18) TaxID=572546 RepID=D2RHE2_ARCPA|nr:hypothetical protein [Archaeoglobus profundus]ADB57717.1 hypothetical protein Arcpr_0652 [Archaeoglobus profundus DSM 5631]